MSKLFKVFLTVMVAAGVACGQIDWSADRITISTAEELHEFRDTANAGRSFAGQTVLLLNDIDLNGKQENQWEPIYGFSGIFDGGGFTVSGIYINVPARIHCGFFCFLHGTVRNLQVDVDITAWGAVGGLTGQNNGTIENVSVKGKVSGVYYVGGLVGVNRGTTRKSYAADVIVSAIDGPPPYWHSAGYSIGGLVGWNDGRIEKSYATVAVETVEGIDAVGALVGDMRGGTITNSFASPHINISFVGSNDGGNVCAISGNKTFPQMRLQSTFTDWDFDDFWGIHSNINDGFPFLRVFHDLTAAVVWGDEVEFTFNGNEHKPTATARTASDIPLPLTISGEATNAGRHTAIAEIADPELALLFNLTNAEIEFEIKPADISRAIVTTNPNAVQYTGDSITPQVSVLLGIGGVVVGLEEDEDYTVAFSNNVGVGNATTIATVTITGRKNYSGTATQTFSITQLEPIDVPVIWENLGPLTFNRIVQGPTPIAITDNGDTLELIPQWGHRSEVGSHTAVAQLVNQNPARPVNLTGTILQDYTIQRRQLTIQVPPVLQNAENLDSAGLAARIRTQINFDNFGTTPDPEDNDRNALRTASTITLTEQPQSAPRQRSLDLLRYRIYLLTISTETTGEQTRNYVVNPITETEIRVAQQCKTCQSWGNTCIATCNDEAFFGPTSIRTSTSPSDRYGIVLENAVVSDLARISVVTPEPTTANIAILDNLGNVVFTADAVGATALGRPQQTPIVWNLTNTNGRIVANGTYLIVVEATGISGRRFTYSTRIGVNR